MMISGLKLEPQVYITAYNRGLSSWWSFRPSLGYGQLSSRVKPMRLKPDVDKWSDRPKPSGHSYDALTWCSPAQCGPGVRTDAGYRNIGSSGVDAWGQPVPSALSSNESARAGIAAATDGFSRFGFAPSTSLRLATLDAREERVRMKAYSPGSKQ